MQNPRRKFLVLRRQSPLLLLNWTSLYSAKVPPYDNDISYLISFFLFFYFDTLHDTSAHLPPPSARTTVRVRILHTDATVATIVSPLTMVGDILRETLLLVKFEHPDQNAALALQNRWSVSLASPVPDSKPTLAIPSVPGGDDTYLDENCPIGLYPYLPITALSFLI